MKYISVKVTAVALAGWLAIGVASIKSCGPVTDWMMGQQQEVLELQTFAVEGFAQVLDTLSYLYAQNPEAFVKLLTLSLQDTNCPIPADLLALLKQFGLVGANAQLTDLVRLVLDWAIEQNSDGSIKIWSLDELVKTGWIRLMVGKKIA